MIFLSKREKIIRAVIFDDYAEMKRLIWKIFDFKLFNLLKYFVMLDIDKKS
jgi:hypothetical protein